MATEIRLFELAMAAKFGAQWGFDHKATATADGVGPHLRMRTDQIKMYTIGNGESTVYQIRTIWAGLVSPDSNTRCVVVDHTLDMWTKLADYQDLLPWMDGFAIRGVMHDKLRILTHRDWWGTIAGVHSVAEGPAVIEPSKPGGGDVMHVGINCQLLLDEI